MSEHHHLIRGLCLVACLFLFGCSNSKPDADPCANGSCEDIDTPPDNPNPQFFAFEEEVGRYSNLAISSEGQWAITAHNPKQGSLRLGVGSDPDNLTWSTIEEDSLDGIGKYNQVLFDHEGTIHIFYYDGKNTDLKHAQIEGTNPPSLETIDANGEVGLYISATIDSDGNLHLSYFDQTHQTAKYATRNSEKLWSLEVIPPPAGFDCESPPCPSATTAYGRFSSIRLKGGLPIIAYYDQSQGNLVLASRGEEGWNALIVDGVDAKTGEDTGDVGAWPSLWVDETGNTSIAYFERQIGSLRYASSFQGQIKVEAIDTGTTLDLETGAAFNHVVGAHVQLIEPVGDEPSIYYLDSTILGIRRAKRTGGTWSFSTLPISNRSGFGLSAKMASDGIVALLFEDWQWTSDEGDSRLKRRLVLWFD